jgi:hypothetical protein
LWKTLEASYPQGSREWIKTMENCATTKPLNLEGNKGSNIGNAKISIPLLKGQIGSPIKLLWLRRNGHSTQFKESPNNVSYTLDTQRLNCKLIFVAWFWNFEGVPSSPPIRKTQIFHRVLLSRWWKIRENFTI